MADMPKSAIVGIGQTEFSKNSGRSELQLAAECIKAALDDAGLQAADVDGLITFTLDGSDEIGVTRCLGIDDLKFASRLPNGGAASVATICHAMSAVESGVCDVVVIWRALNERSQYRFGQPAARGAPPTGGGTGFMEWCMPFGAQFPASWEALTAQAYMHKYGVGNEDFGLVSVLLRKHAATNPGAWFYGKPITIADHQASRWIVAPALRLLDCCQESDGGVAIVVASMARARQLRQKPVGIFGAVTAMRFNHETITNYYHSADITRLPISERVRDRLSASCGIAPKDTQVAMIYDNFTPQIFLQLEAYGYCGAGEARDYIKSGHLELDGSSPLSPNGGHIGEGYIHGLNLITEGVRQARGTAANQVADVRHVFLASGMAGAIVGTC
jgi:acetyl-CoA acetyltransferase